MADHINIHAPQKRYDLQDELARAHMEAEMTVLRNRYDKMADDLDAIFTRIARGEQVELHYPDGTMVPITRARRRNAGEAES